MAAPPVHQRHDALNDAGDLDAPGVQPYQHIEDREEIVWGLDFGQLVYLGIGVLSGVLFGMYLSPLPAQLTLFVAIVLAGLPVVVSSVASNGDLAPWTVMRAAWRWTRRPRRYVPGAGECPGYYVWQAPGPEPRRNHEGDRRRTLEEALPL
jgi:hypothetical protein